MFLRLKEIESVTTQGRQDLDQWVTSYTLETSLTGSVRTPVNFGQVFTANSDRDTKVVNTMSPNLIAISIRLRPVTWNNRISMRWAVDGCDYTG